MRTTSWLARGVLALAMGMGALSGCERAGEATVVEPAEELAPGIHPAVVLGARAGDTVRAELRLHQVGMSAVVSSFQGELAYDAGEMELADVELPRDVMVAWNKVEEGKIRFAGATTEGLRSEPMLVLRFVPRSAMSAASFKLHMEEIVAEAEGFQNVTARVVPRERPLFSTTPLPAAP
ncbi:MAG TPA: hypothetical protein VF613_21400 [Longimicrobium sp.]|jgi:hypothetical protein